MKRLILAVVPAFFALLPLKAFATGEFRVFVKSDVLSYEYGNPAWMEICVQNLSDRNAFFKVYPAPYTTFQPIVYTMEGTEEETRVRYRKSNRTVDQVTAMMVPRIIELAPNEIFHYKADLRDFYNLVPGRRYSIRGFFLPDARQPMVVRSDNTLVVNMNRSLDTEVEPAEVLRKPKINPAEVAVLFLRAEKDGRWADMIKYLNLESYINVYPDFAMSYNSGTEAQKRAVLRDFISHLSRPRTDYILDYDVRNEEINDEGRSALVKAFVRRHGSVTPFSYEYRFTMEKSGALWRITSADATIKKDRRR